MFGNMRAFTNKGYKNSSHPWFTCTSDPLNSRQFYGGIDNNQLVSGTEPALTIGTLIQQQGNPDQFLISQCHYLANRERYDILKITHTADVQRFSAEGSRDSFGRVSIDTPATVYLALPMHLFPQDRSRPDVKVDRASEATVYKFACPGSCTLAVKDQLVISTQTLSVTAVLLSVAGLTEVLCTDTA